MSHSLAVLLGDLIQGRFQLLDILRRAGIQGLLHYLLLRKAAAAKGGLQDQVSSQARIDLHQAMCSCQHGNPAIVQLVNGVILHRFWAICTRRRIGSNRSRSCSLTPRAARLAQLLNIRLFCVLHSLMMGLHSSNLVCLL